MAQRLTPLQAWLGLGVLIGIYDVALAKSNHPTLSSDFRHAARLHPVVISLPVVYLLSHLYGVLPAEFDALRLFGSRRRKS